MNNTSSLSTNERWLVGLDIDGTLVHDECYISPEVAKEVSPGK